MSKYRTRWSPEELDIARAMREQGEDADVIAFALGRTTRAVTTALRNPNPEPKKSGFLSPFYDGPAIERCPTYERYKHDAIIGSKHLRIAIERAGVRP
jgi:hypothetical protein